MGKNNPTKGYKMILYNVKQRASTDEKRWIHIRWMEAHFFSLHTFLIYLICENIEALIEFWKWNETPVNTRYILLFIAVEYFSSR